MTQLKNMLFEKHYDMFRKIRQREIRRLKKHHPSPFEMDSDFCGLNVHNETFEDDIPNIASRIALFEILKFFFKEETVFFYKETPNKINTYEDLLLAIKHYWWRTVISVALGTADLATKQDFAERLLLILKAPDFKTYSQHFWARVLKENGPNNRMAEYNKFKKQIDKDFAPQKVKNIKVKPSGTVWDFD